MNLRLLRQTLIVVEIKPNRWVENVNFGAYVKIISSTT